MVAMKQHGFDDFPALILVIRRRPYKICTLMEAANALLSHWGDDDGEEYVVAVKTCLDAIYGHVSSHEARRALIKAADEAGIRVLALVGSPIEPAAGAKTAA
jgi:hypothetical protein